MTIARLWPLLARRGCLQPPLPFSDALAKVPTDNGKPNLLVDVMALHYTLLRRYRHDHARLVQEIENIYRPELCKWVTLVFDNPSPDAITKAKFKTRLVRHRRTEQIRSRISRLEKRHTALINQGCSKRKKLNRIADTIERLKVALWRPDISWINSLGLYLNAHDNHFFVVLAQHEADVEIARLCGEQGTNVVVSTDSDFAIGYPSIRYLLRRVFYGKLKENSHSI